MVNSTSMCLMASTAMVSYIGSLFLLSHCLSHWFGIHSLKFIQEEDKLSQLITCMQEPMTQNKQDQSFIILFQDPKRGKL